MNPQNILLIRPDRLGDLILSIPVAQVLKEKYPFCRITYLASSGPAKIAPMINCVDEWIEDASGTKRLGFFKLVRLFNRNKFDLSIELKPSWRTAAAGFISRIPIRIGTARRFYSFLYTRRLNLHRRNSGKHQTDLDLALLEPLGINVSGVVPFLSLPEQFKYLAANLVGKSIKEYIVIHPGSGESAPNWPLKYYKELAKLILNKTTFGVIITGLETDPGDFDGCLNLCGKTNLAELSGILTGASLFVSGSTGPLHLADALGIKSLAFFTRHKNVDANRWGPRRHPEGVIIPEVNNCISASPAQCRCLEQITPGQAFNRVQTILNIKAGEESILP